MAGEVNHDASRKDLAESDLRGNAKEFFSGCDSLLVWCWDDAVPGGCHPRLVASAFARRGLLPESVKVESLDFLVNRIEKESALSGERLGNRPMVEAFQDQAGRVVWHLDFAGMTADERTTVGRAILRPPVCGSWNLIDGNHSYPGGAKICYLNRAGEIDFDPTGEDLAASFESMAPEEDVDINFLLIWRHGPLYYAWMTREGFVVEVAHHPPEVFFRAAYSGPLGGSREIEYVGPCAEAEFISRNHAFDILMRFFANPHELPQCRELIWREMRREPIVQQEHKIQPL